MPESTLRFAADLLEEVIEERSALPPNPEAMKKDDMLDKEKAYQALILELSDNEIILKALPDLLEHEEWPIQLQAFLLSALQPSTKPDPDVADFVYQKVKEEKVFFHWLGWIPPDKTEQFIKSYQCDDYIKRLSMLLSERNALWQDIIKLKAKPPNSEYISYLAALPDENCEESLLKLLDGDASIHHKAGAAVSLLRIQQSEGLNYLHRPEVISSEFSGYGFYTAVFGDESDLRQMEKTLDGLLGGKNKIDDALLLVTQKVFENLSQFGDTLSAKWLCEKVLLQTNARIRFEAFTALLNLLSDEQAKGGHTLLDEALIKEDALGQYKQLNNKDCERYFTSLFLSVDSDEKLLPPHCHCRSGAPYDQLAELSDALEDLTFGDTLLADQIRMDFAIFSGQHFPLDPYAPYERFIQQRNDLSEAIQRFRNESEYVPGSFKLWR